MRTSPEPGPSKPPTRRAVVDFPPPARPGDARTAPPPAARGLARWIGGVDLKALYHPGNGSHIFMNSVDDDTIMITVFGGRTTVGLVRFYSVVAAQAVAELLKSIHPANGPGFSFEPANVNAGPIFADR